MIGSTGGLMDYQLICEGKCNPLISEADELAKKFASDVNRGRRFDRTERMFSLQRRLVYTPHTRGHLSATCDECGTKRRYGNY